MLQDGGLVVFGHFMTTALRQLSGGRGSMYREKLCIKAWMSTAQRSHVTLRETEGCAVFQPCDVLNPSSRVADAFRNHSALTLQ
jgi:hypothetical protein